jgi:hypothetical protein
MNFDIRRCLAAISLVLLTSGCSTLVAYSPQASGSNQSVKYTQGVGTVSMRDSDQELFMYPAFKTQGPTQPTFVIGYANNAAAAENFSPENIKAYFRGTEVPIYTYTEKIAEIRNEKLGKQVALAILGGAAAVAAARNASRQTYTSNYSGSVWGRGGRVGFAGSSTVRVYDPAAGMLAGAAVGGATGLGIAQLEYNAQNQEAAAEAILQANTVEPQQMVTGSVILKGCCDVTLKNDDAIRFDVTANGKVSSFTFRRTALGSAPPPGAPTVGKVAADSGTPLVQPARLQPIPVPPTAVVAVPQKVPTPVAAAPVPIVSATATQPRPSVAPVLKGGQDEYQVRQLAKAQSCSASPQLTAKGAGFETYVVTCSNGDVVNYRCELGNCRELK